MACNTQQFTLGIRNVIIGETSKQLSCITAKADVSGSLGGKYFVVHEPVTQIKHVFWFSNGTASAPVVPGATIHAIVYTNNASAQTLAGLIATALNAESWVGTATASGTHVDFDMAVNGYAYAIRDALQAGKKCSFKFVVDKFGRVQADAGPTNGDITVTLEEQVSEVTSPQTGDFLLGEIRRGVRVSMAFELKDSSEEKIRDAINYYGNTYVADDSSEAVLSGFGASNLFKSTEDVATQVILRTPEAAENNDPSQDFTVHKAKLKLGELTLSGENEFVLPIEVVAYLDKTKFSGLNLFSYGDASKIIDA
jgi:hypothetical protein